MDTDKKKELQHSEFIARRQEGNLYPRRVISLWVDGESFHYPFSEEIIYTKAARDNYNSHYSIKQGESVRCIRHTAVFSEYSDQFNDDYVGIEDIGNQTSDLVRVDLSELMSLLGEKP